MGINGYYGQHYNFILSKQMSLLGVTQLRLHSSFYKQKTGVKAINIFHKRKYRIITSLSAHCKTYCFAFQKQLFCTVKA